MSARLVERSGDRAVVLITPTTPQLAERLAERERAAHADADAWRADVAAADKHLARLERVERAILARFRRGDLSEAGLDGELADLKRERVAVAEQRDRARQIGEQLRAGRRQLKTAAQLLEELGEAVASALPAERRRILRLLIAPGGIVLQPWGHVEISVAVPTSAGRSLEAVYSSPASTHLRLRIVA
jgi:hypothetical protein